MRTSIKRQPQKESRAAGDDGRIFTGSDRYVVHTETLRCQEHEPPKRRDAFATARWRLPWSNAVITIKSIERGLCAWLTWVRRPLLGGGEPREIQLSKRSGE